MDSKYVVEVEPDASGFIAKLMDQLGEQGFPGLTRTTVEEFEYDDSCQLVKRTQTVTFGQVA